MILPFILRQQTYSNFVANHIVINIKSYHFGTRKNLKDHQGSSLVVQGLRLPVIQAGLDP